MGDSPLLDHGLSLGLSMSMNTNTNTNTSFPHLQTTTSAHDLQLNLRTPCLVQSSCSSAAVSGLFIPPPLKQQALSFTMEESLVSSDADRNSETQAFLLGIDVNRPLSGSMEFEDEAGVSSPNSTISSVSGKRGKRETNGKDPENQPACSRGMSDQEDRENCRKKLRLSKDQSVTLEESFREHNSQNPKQKLALAKQLGLRPRQVEIWFQNRRARTKLKQTEVDCEFLKRCCENLAEENMRLQTEVRELRSLKLSPQFYTRLSPPTTLTVCPSCEHLLIPYYPTSSVGPIGGFPMFDARQQQGYVGSK